MKELEITVRIRNNRIKERRIALGKTQEQASIECGLCLLAFGAIERCDYSQWRPWGDDGWTKQAKAIARYFGVDPEELFPDSVLAIEKNEETRKLDGHEMLRLDEAPRTAMLSEWVDPVEQSERDSTAHTLVDGLYSRHARAVELRYGLDGRGERTFKEIGDELGVSTSRAQSLVKSGIRQARDSTLGKAVAAEYA